MKAGKISAIVIIASLISIIGGYLTISSGFLSISADESTRTLIAYYWYRSGIIESTSWLPLHFIIMGVSFSILPDLIVMPRIISIISGVLVILITASVSSLLFKNKTITVLSILIITLLPQRFLLSLLPLPEWHLIYKLQKGPENIFFDTDIIKFLEKDHTIVPEANIVQLCDCVIGAITNIIHGVEESNRGKYRTELLDLMLPLVDRMTTQSSNKNSSYKHYKRIMLSFFPKNKSILGDLERNTNQFYTKRPLKYFEDKSRQGNLF